MTKAQTIEDFYQSQFNCIPESLKREMGHFNVFRREEFCCHNKPVPYSRKDYYKITLLKGPNKIHYADKTVLSERNALMFSNPMIPYNWEPLDDRQSGVFCIFTEEFFGQYGTIKDYPIYQPGSNLVYLLDDNQLKEIESIFQKMFEEIASDYLYKYDVLRGLVFNLIHTALKMQLTEATRLSPSNGTARIASLFAELLERQFPIESPMQRMKLRSPNDFAAQLSIHVNHLNRSLKEVTGKTTSQLIAERVSQEARALLKHTNWNISEIAWSLGFEELPHFINFFKKNFNQTPKLFRNETNV
jgi:AraC-like DNA-binding protein